MAGNSLKKLKESLHYIPTGRQLPRTPPPLQVKQRLEFPNEDEKSHIVEFKQGPEGGSSEHPDPDVFQVNDIKPVLGAFSDSLVNGMKDYQLTASDQDFMMKMQVEKQIKQLEGELVELRNMLQTELVLESTLYPGDNVQAELQKSSSYSELVAHHKKEDVDRAPSKKKEKKQAISQKETSWRKEDTNEREHLAEQLVGHKTTIQQLMRDLADLKSKLASIEMDRQEVATPTAPKTNLPTSRKAAGKDATKQEVITNAAPRTNLPTRRKPAGKGSNDPSKSKAVKIPKEAAGQQTPADQSKPKRGARGRPKAVRQEAAATSPVQSVKQADEVKRGRPAGRRLKQQQEEKKEEQPNIVLRRSKRIANMK
ncbi:uncharacterized protein ACBT44_003071 isoform 2-T2 [Syngnathus typhle]